MKKKAMAIEIVLIFAAIMGIVGLFLLKTTQNNNKQLETSMAQLQSYFIARAGVEHVMLKVKYLHRELYDAVCLYQGRNPLFNYKGIDSNYPYKNICATNPGPIFLFTSTEQSSDRPKSGTVFSKMDTFTSGPYTNYSKWLDKFKEDLNSNYADNSCLDMLNLDANVQAKMKLGTSEFSPFKSAQYSLTNLDLGAFSVNENAGKIDNTVSISFTIESSYESAKQQPYNYKISRSITVSRE